MGLTYWTGGIIIGLSGIYKDAIFKINPNEIVIIGCDPVYSNIVIGMECKFVSKKHYSVKFNSKYNAYEVFDYSKNGIIINKTTLLTKGRSVSVVRGSIIEIRDSKDSFKLM